MIPDIKELNFPKKDGKQYATLTQATVNIADMGEKTITTQVRIDGGIVPDFSQDWEVEFQGEKYIMPLRIPAGAKENTSLNSTIDLTFQHWAVWQLKRWPFVTIQPIKAGTYIADEEVASVQLNLGDFCVLFGQVLDYYYGDAIRIDLNPAWQYDSAPTLITISHTKIWNVLIDAFYPKYGVRWEIAAAEATAPGQIKGGDRYVIKVGYPTTEVDHVFEYGFEGGLLKVERQVQSEEIRNMLKGRGGETNIPFRYFKNTDPNNPDFRPDPDWVEELANIYFPNLMPATFRSYVQGWKAAHISKYLGYTAVGENNAYAPWAYRKGYTDTVFSPVEFVADEITINPGTGDKQVEILPGYSPYVKKGSSLDKYGPLPDTLDNNDEIYPTLQGTGLDIAVAVEQIESDDVAESSENDAQIEDATYPDIVKTNVAQGHKTAADASKRTYFTVASGKTAIIEGYAGAKAYNPKNHEDKSSLIAELDYTIKVFSATTGEEHSASGIPTGSWYFTVEYSFNNTSPDSLNVTLSFNSVKITSATPDDKWRNTFDIWVKNIWDSARLSGETDAQYAERVWKPVLGDKEKNTAKVVFTSGALVHEDYEFTIVGFPVPDSSKTYEGEQSHWRITLAKSEAELEATGLYVPSTKKQGKAGDTFVFIGTEMTHEPYVVDAEERLDDWKKDQLGEVKEIKPTAVVTTDRVRLNNEGKPNALINQLRVGNSLRLFDKRFFNEEGKAYETLYLQSITYTYREPSSDDAALNPDVEIVLGNEYTISANPVSMMQSEISALQRQVGAISNVEQIVRAVGDRLYLRKDGISDRSLSPTQFFSLMTSGDFRAGLIGGAGWGFFKDENGNWVLETDRLSVRQDMSVNTLVINQAEGRGGMEIDTAAYIDGVTRVEDTPEGYVCYFDQKGGSVANLFHVDDVAFCNRWTPENADLKFYRRRVTAVGADYITLSKTDVNGTGVPAEGDNIIHFGNYTDKTRQYIKVRDVVGGGYERYIEELNSVNAAGVEYYYVGKQAGKSRWFVGNKDLVPYSGKGDGSYIEYIDRKFNLHNVRLSITSSIVSETTDSEGNPIVTEKPLGNYFKEFQQQIDGVVESFNGQGAPTLTNYPASGWTTDEERKRHNRDIYTDITPYVDDATTPTAGQSWRWYYNSETDYGWVKIADSDAVKALQMAKLSVLDNDVLFIQTNSETVEPALPTVNTEGTITALNGWSSQAPTWQNGKYIWQTTYVKKGNGSVTFSGPTCISGINGQSITIKSKSVKYSTVHNSATQPADATFTLTSVPTLTAGQYLWSRTEVVYSNNDSTVAYGVSRIGTNGTNGTSITIRSTSVTYAKTTTPTQPADSAFTYSSIGAAGVKAGEYLWTKTEIVYSDNTPVKTYSVSRIGSDGTNGTPGTPGTDGRTPYIHWAYANSADGVTNFSTTYFKDALYVGTCTDYNVSDPTTPSSYEWSRLRGEDGRGIVSVKEMYAVNNDSTTAPADSAFSETIPQTSATNRYLWNMETTTYTDNTSESTAKIIIGVHGANGEAGASITGVTNYYLASASATGVTTVTAGWTTDASASAATMTDAKPYLWNYEKITYSKGNPTQTTPHVVGRLGRGVAKIEEEYYLSTSQTQLAGGSWLSEANKPAWQPGKFMWTRTKVTYTDGKTEYMGAVCVTGTPGTSVLAQYSADGSAWHPTFAAGDVWMRTSDDGGTTWSPAMRVVGEAGKDGQWRKFQWAKNNSATTAPTGIWYDTPLTAAAGEYVWMRSGIVVPPATAPVIWDTATRLTGDKGADGQSVYMLDIDNEVSGVICDASGAVTGAYPTSQASVYKGSTKLTSGVTYSIPQKTGISTVNITTAGAITMSGMSADKAEITVQAKVDGVTLTSVVSLYKVKPGANGQAAVMYSIEPSVGNITRSMTGVLSATSVTCSVYKTTGNTARVLTGDHTLTYKRLPDGATGTLTRTNGVSSAVTVLPTTEAVIFELKNGSTVLDRERVPVLADASDLEIGGRNLLLNTAFNGKESWTFSDITRIDESKPYMGHNSVKFSASGFTNNQWHGLRQKALCSVKGGDVLTLSLYSFTSDKSTVDAEAKMEIDCWTEDNVRLSIANILITPTANDIWEKKVFTRQLPASTAYVIAYIYLVKNGTLWINSPKLEFGNVATDWSPAPEDIENRVDTFDYLKEALAQDGAVQGGLALLSHIRVGVDTDTSSLTQKTYAGLNGLYVNDKTIASWWGGDMIDRENLASGQSIANAAAALVRMDGTGYFAKGNIMWRADGSGSVAGGKLSWDASGNVTLGAGVTVAGGSGMSDTTLTSLLQFVNGINQLIVPVDASGNELPYNGLTNSDGTTKIKAIKAKFNFYSVGGVSSLGMGSATGGGSGSGGGASALVDLLDVSISNLTKGQMLQYNGTHWANVSGIATETYVNTRINNLINGAPAAYDTLKEIADVLQGNVNSIGDIMTALGNKADKSQLGDYVTLGTAQTVSGQKTFSSAVRIGRADNTGDHNAIYFYGTTGDNPGSFNHTWIAERLWGGTESSELVLFKGNDVGNHTDAATVSTSGPDRIRHIAFGHLFQVPTATMSGLPSAVCASTSLKNVFGMARDRVTSYVDLYATSFIKSGGTASQFLMANGSVKALSDITSAYVTALGTSGNYLTWTKNGAVNNITVPFATAASVLNSSGRLSAISNAKHGAGIRLYEAYGASANYPTNYGNVLAAQGNAAIGAGELLMGWSGSDGGYAGLYYRNCRDNTNTWSPWVTILDSSNFNSVIGSNLTAYVKKAGDTMTGDLLFSNSGTATRQMQFKCGDNDYGRIAAGATASNAGWMEIATADDGNEPIYARQYSGAFTTLVRTATLLDASGNTAFPGRVNASYFTANSTTLCTNLNADLLDGLHLTDIRRVGYAMQDTIIDASALDENTWYPVTIGLGARDNVRIEILVSLDSGTKPSWSTHSNGFSVRAIWEANGSGWGTNPINRTIYASDYIFAAPSPVRGIGQMSNSSIEYVFVRGGGKYRFRLSNGITPVLRTGTFTSNNQSVSPTTTEPTAIVRNNALITDNVASATRLQGTYSLWGQNFYGNNVSGNMTGVGSITASGEIKTTSANAFRAVFGNYGFFIRNDGNDTYFLLTNSGDQHGSFNSLRPLRINNVSGLVYMSNGLRIGSATLSWDSANNALKIDGNVYATGGVSALGASGVSGDTGAGSLFGLMKSWPTSAPSSATTDALGANLGYELHTRVKSLEGGSATSITTTGSGNAITAISKSGTVITATKGATFLTAHQSLTDYFKRGGGEAMPAAYVDLTTYTSGAANYKNYQPGTYQIARNNYSDLVVNLALNTGSTSALQFLTNYSDNADLKYRKTIDSNRVSGPWRKILTELNTKIENGVITINGTSITPLTSHQSLANYVTLNTAQSISGAKTFTSGNANCITLRRSNTNGGAFIDYYAMNSTTEYWRVGMASDKTFGFAWKETLTNAKIDSSGNITATAFKKSGSSDSYFLLGGGGHKALSDYYTKSEVNTKLTDGSVTKLGTATVGSASRPVYLNGGVPTAGSYTFGNASGNAAVNNGTVNTNLNADMLDGVHASGLFTALSNNASNNLSITVGGTTRQLRIGAIGAYEALTVSKNDNGGRPVYLLIADVTTWYGTTSSGAADTGIIGYFYGRRGGNMAGTSVQKIIAWCTHNNTLYRLQTDTTENNAILPRIVKYNNKYYLALYMTGSGRDHYFIGTKTANLLTSFITVNSDTSGQFAGLTVVHSESGMSHYGNASSATTLATARTINGTSFNGSANITTSYWGTARNISIADSTSAHTGAATSVNGSGDVTLKLPATIAATSFVGALSGNATTATTLQTTRTIWGQNFNGAANVSGNMTGVGNIDMTGNLRLKGSANFGNKINFGDGDFVYLHEATDDVLTLYAAKGINLNSNTGTIIHNVDIRPSTSNARRLGSATINYAGVHSRQLINNTEALMWIWQATNHEIAFATNAVERMRISAAGTVAINITSPSSEAKLHVGGNIVATGGITALSTSSTSDMRLKRVIRDITLDIRQIAGAPSFIHAWKDAAEYGGGEFAGSSAQYWLRVLPQAVSGKQWLALDYGKTALLSAIALARRSETHEQRIRRLEKENERLREQIRQIKNSIF